MSRLQAPFVLLCILLSCHVFPSKTSSIPGIQKNGHLLTPDPPNGHWVDTWTAMPQLTEPSNLPPLPFNGTSTIFDNSTIRQTFKITTGAAQIRIRLSNAFGTTGLAITSATLAHPHAYPGQNLTGSSGIETTSLQTLSFSGNTSITIPPGALAVSDPLAFPVKPNEVITLSIYLQSGQAGNAITSHPGSRTQSWISLGDYTSATNFTDISTTSVFHWYFVSAIEAWQEPSFSAFAIAGDSITDGRGSDPNGNNRWPDLLFNRLQSTPNINTAHPSSSSPNSLLSQISILNQAAGGNRVLADGLGPSALSRIERDVLSHSGVKYAMIFSGVNDIGTASPDPYNQTIIASRIIHAYRQIISRIHAQRLPVFGATITPFGCMNTTLQPYSDPERERTRVRVNEWVRGSVGTVGGFDAVVDFDAVVRDPGNGTRLREEFDVGDCLHLNPAGYRAMADGFPVDVFGRFEGGVQGFV